MNPGAGAPAMEVVDGLDGLEPSLGRLFIVIGVFDGLHLGHRYLLEQLVREGGRHGGRPAVLTFDHHPDAIITGSAPPLLCDPRERLERLEAAGVEVTIVQHFDRALRETPYDAFVRRIAAKVDLAGFLMTPDSAFGYERHGTPETVLALGRQLGYDVVVVPPFTLEGAPVTSSAIRAAIASGDLREASRLLGRAISVVGTVDRTLREATPIEFPVPVALPPPGRYQAAVRTNGGSVRQREAVVDAEGLRIVPAAPATKGTRLTVELLRA